MANLDVSSYSCMLICSNAISILNHVSCFIRQIAILFSDLRRLIELFVKKYGEDVRIFSEQLYKLSNSPDNGNLHFVQNIFEGPFEVFAPTLYHIV